MSIDTVSKPTQRPRSPGFSCGPAAKIPGWSLDMLRNATVGRSHRTSPAKEKIKRVGDEVKSILNLPEGYLVATISGSATGATESAMWNLLGSRPVDVFAWEAFGLDWVIDAVEELKPLTVRPFVGAYGVLPDLRQANFDHDVVFTWNGTAAGVKVPDDASWIPEDRKGLVICDATSAAFGMPMPWHKLDVVAFSWQKMLGSEAQHGVVVIGPRAIERLETTRPPWPVPKLYRYRTRDGKFNRALFDGEIVNTVSLLCVEDMLNSLAWVKSMGGEQAMIKRCRASGQTIFDWVDRTPWVDYLAVDPATRSYASVCVKFIDPDYLQLSEADQRAFCRNLVARIEAEGVAYDFNGYKDAPPGLRIWCGATIEPDDVKILTQWIDWSFAEEKKRMKRAA